MPQPSSSPSIDYDFGQGLGSSLKQLSIPSPLESPLPYVVTTLVFFLLFYSFGPKPSSIPHLNPKKPLEFSNLRAKKLFAFHSREILGEWFKSAPEKVVRVIADVGEVLILPPRFANEIKNDERLSFSRFTYDVCFPPSIIE